MPDDWELDDWEDDEFDEDVWDASQAELEDAFDTDLGEDVDLLDAGLLDGGVGIRAPTNSANGDGGGGAMGWSAWEIGTVFALGGWLADHHAEQTARQVAAALADAPTAAGASNGPRGAPHPPPSSGYAYGQTRSTLPVGAVLEQGALFAELSSASAGGRDLMLQAEGEKADGGVLVLVISAVPSSSGPRLWVVAEERAGGFSATRLVPVFTPERGQGLAVFATDHAREAADAVAWACMREGMRPAGLTVTTRR